MAKPQSDIDLSVTIVRELLRTQHPDLSELPITEVASGWDNAIFRLGQDMAVRLPRRAAAATLLENEQRWLPVLQGQLPVPVPTPIRIGYPQSLYPWRWSITPWIVGDTADRSPLHRSQAKVLADFLEALHTPAPSTAPRNAYRGVPLVQRHAKFVSSTTALAERGYSVDDRLIQLWRDAMERPTDISPTWIHGDIHSHNVLVAHGRIVGVIDWGDIAQGDRATDLAAAWILFSERESREEFIAACKSVSPDTWQRARGWALLLAVVVLAADDPTLVRVAEQTLQGLLDGS